MENAKRTCMEMGEGRQTTIEIRNQEMEKMSWEIDNVNQKIGNIQM